MFAGTFISQLLKVPLVGLEKQHYPWKVGPRLWKGTSEVTMKRCTRPTSRRCPRLGSNFPGCVGR